MTDDIVFLRRGAFVRTVGGNDVFADAGTVQFFNRWEPYRVTHPIEGGDDCTALSFAPEVLASALSIETPPAAGASFARTDAPVGARALARLQWMRARTARLPASELESDECALALLADLAGGLGCGSPRHRVGAARPATAVAHRDAAHAVRGLLARDLSARHTLAGLARAVNVSPFHLARVFARATGAPIHRHLLCLRLRAALERLAAGAEDLTSLALDLGFASHSHFTDAFRREFGAAPSHWRRALGGAAARKIPEARLRP